MAVAFKPIKPLLQTGTSAYSRWFSYIGLGIGVLLLLCSVQMFINIQHLLKEGSIRKDGFDFVSITKNITNETMGQPEKNLFQPQDIEDIKKQPFIAGVSPLLANDFRVQLSAGNIVPFSTDMFLEALDNEFIDTLPSSFQWQEGEQNIPIILSSDFFEIYNIFAPGQGLPQLSKESAMGMPVVITCFGRDNSVNFTGRIVAFSDRVNSVLVPKNFLEWANRTFSNRNRQEASRLFLKLKDVNDPQLIRYLDSKNYVVNKDKTLLGRNKMVLQGIFSGLGIFGLLVVVLALMLFSFYLQLVIARSRESLELLLTLGYSPKWLGKNVSNQFVPVYIFIVLTALLFTQLMQWAFHKFVLFNRPELSTAVSWMVLLLAVLLILMAVVTNARLVKKLLHQLG
ncbi:hypothetical protein A8C56_00250 [Niabella ginsenosidivorans]|uniref:ABC3 transporter permease protein domain-containing protein n=1 Tax=Niabella ginsenosidivorans TaxID=1176587 RepID=A0A1A9HYQ3_9BACT|nr:FtsX-like permease family protein [Niabella ginsenosidivorans]ANH79610.1 hypothetical protein A8C56_00250 [Niabella ginsenosidivorans]